MCYVHVHDHGIACEMLQNARASSSFVPRVAHAPHMHIHTHAFTLVLVRARETLAFGPIRVSKRCFVARFSRTVHTCACCRGFDDHASLSVYGRSAFACTGGEGCAYMPREHSAYCCLMRSSCLAGVCPHVPRRAARSHQTRASNFASGGACVCFVSRR